MEPAPEPARDRKPRTIHGSPRGVPTLPKVNRELLESLPQRVRVQGAKIRKRDWDALIELVGKGRSRRSAAAELRISERRVIDEMAANPEFRDRLEHAEALRIGNVQDANYLACTVPDSNGRFDSRAQALFLANAVPDEYAMRPGGAMGQGLPPAARLEIHLSAEQRAAAAELVSRLLGVGPAAPDEKVVEALPAETPAASQPEPEAPLAAELLPAPPGETAADDLW